MMHGTFRLPITQVDPLTSSPRNFRATGQVMECAEDPSLKGREGAFPLVCVTQANVPVVAGRS